MLDANAIDAWPGKEIDGKFHPALWHMLDVGAVADHLIEKRKVTGSSAWDQAIALLIVLHDLGKISESFRNQIKGCAARAEHHSQLLESLIAGAPGARRALYAAVAGHHGGPPELEGAAALKSVDG